MCFPYYSKGDLALFKRKLLLSPRPKNITMCLYNYLPGIGYLFFNFTKRRFVNILQLVRFFQMALSIQQQFCLDKGERNAMHLL